MKLYHGVRTEAGAVVDVTIRPGIVVKLDARRDLRNHSPTGLEWGYEGSGPSQLALALCCSVLRHDGRACRVYQEFKRRVIAPITANEWWLDEAVILAEIERIEKEASRG